VPWLVDVSCGDSRVIAEPSTLPKTGSKLHGLLRRMGMGRAVVFTLFWRAWSFLSGPLTLLLLSRYLTREEQGFYFTFNSVIALQVLFGLGLTYVILQFASHEKAFLEWDEAGLLCGDAQAKARLASLLRSSLRYYGIASLLMVSILLPAGVVFFQSQQHIYPGVAWLWPWCFLVASAALSLLTSPLFALLEGCNLVSEVALARLAQSVMSYLFMWIALSANMRLWAAPVLAAFSALTGLIWLVVRKGSLFGDLWKHADRSATIDWRREVWPFQWKVALSWLSSYFAYQVYNPILFKFQGAGVAGQMGMSLSVMNGIVGVASTWVQTRAPEMGALVAKGEPLASYAVFQRSTRRALFAAVLLGGLAFGLVVWLAYGGYALSARLLSPTPFGLLMLTMPLCLLIVAQGCYLRAYKQEPFLWPVVAFSATNTVAIYLLARFANVDAMLWWNLALNLIVSLGFCQVVFVRQCRSLHSRTSTSSVEAGAST
jgi:hypothetical protein